MTFLKKLVVSERKLSQLEFEPDSPIPYSAPLTIIILKTTLNYADINCSPEIKWYILNIIKFLFQHSTAN